MGLPRTQGAFGGTLTVKTQPTVTYNAVKDSYQFTVTLTGATASVTGFLKAGDQVKFTNTYWLQQQTKQALYNGATPLASLQRLLLMLIQTAVAM